MSLWLSKHLRSLSSRAPSASSPAHFLRNLGTRWASASCGGEARAHNKWQNSVYAQKTTLPKLNVSIRKYGAPLFAGSNGWLYRGSMPYRLFSKSSIQGGVSTKDILFPCNLGDLYTAGMFSDDSVRTDSMFTHEDRNALSATGRSSIIYRKNAQESPFLKLMAQKAKGILKVFSSDSIENSEERKHLLSLVEKLPCRLPGISSPTSQDHCHTTNDEARYMSHAQSGDITSFTLLSDESSGLDWLGNAEDAVSINWHETTQKKQDSATVHEKNLINEMFNDLIAHDTKCFVPASKLEVLQNFSSLEPEEQKRLAFFLGIFPISWEASKNTLQGAETPQLIYLDLDLPESDLDDWDLHALLRESISPCSEEVAHTQSDLLKIDTGTIMKITLDIPIFLRCENREMMSTSCQDGTTDLVQSRLDSIIRLTESDHETTESVIARENVLELKDRGFDCLSAAEKNDLLSSTGTFDWDQLSFTESATLISSRLFWTSLDSEIDDGFSWVYSPVLQLKEKIVKTDTGHWTTQNHDGKSDNGSILNPEFQQAIDLEHTEYAYLSLELPGLAEISHENPTNMELTSWLILYQDLLLG
ncbi:hypothetical protein METBIDRAFT_82156 [Metschnikowia bicuspidata var. bicuspidata NRRL YB-4993]|uniref:Uncharacterized protein n=1 Tax=Metschnikowia bicuspidata var. bicuspidata NRRL YB-4993 TaxID=869754 RepID=A0A1A0HE25_9ASCO|nr:hypothetical protein METBIDRAFT_82156 [Metschnikowia bicuspidata var. bicuspidata NRRL YB-4993]OBA22152.1 hypothetical protein METBIDRAFT_82156 [Metschnikowia bicuspidata var. bicuspidata NRRL YB-4993]